MASQTAYVEGEPAPSSGFRRRREGRSRGGEEQGEEQGIRAHGNTRVQPHSYGLQPHRYELAGVKPQMDAGASPCSRGEGKQKRYQHPFSAGLGQPRGNKASTPRRALWTRGCSCLRILRRAEHGVDVKQIKNNVRIHSPTHSKMSTKKKNNDILLTHQKKITHARHVGEQNFARAVLGPDYATKISILSLVVKHGCGSTLTLFFRDLYKEGG